MAVGLKAKLCVVAMWACVGLLGCFSPVKYATDLEVPRLEASYGDVSLEGEIVDRWWESYGDANLNAYVTAVLEHNPTLHVAYLRLVDSELSYRQSVSGYYPDVSFGAGVGYGGTASSESKSDPSYSLGLTASYEVDLWGKVRAQKRIGELTVQSSRDAAETAAISLVGNVVSQWLTIQYTRDRKALTEELLSISEDYCRLVEEYYRNGQTTGMDVLEQRQQIETLRATLKEQETTIRVGLHALEILSGRQVKPHVEGSLPEQVVMGGTPNIDALLERRPDLRSARRQVESADAQVVVALANRLPSLKLSTSLAFRSSSIVDLFKALIWDVGANLVVPLFDGFQQTTAIDRAKVSYLLEETSYFLAVYEAVAEVEEALLMLSLREQQLLDARAELARQREILDVSREYFVEGALDYSRVLTALRGLITTSQSELDARRQVLLAQVAVYKAMGGATWLEETSERGVERARTRLETIGETQEVEDDTGHEEGK